MISKNLITREDIRGKNNYLIVGGNSFIGINFALGLLKQGQNAKVFSRHINNFPQNIISEVEFIKGNLANVEDIYISFSKCGYYYLFSCNI